MNKKMYKINSKSLEQELSKRNLSKSQVSLAIGFGGTYITNVTSRSLIAEPAMKLLKTYFNIDPESYIVPEPEPEPEQNVAEKDNDVPAKVEVSIDYTRLGEVLYDSVFRAVRDALQA